MNIPTAAAPDITLTRNPATGEVIAQTPQHTPQQLRAAIQAARAAQPAWAARPLAERGQYITGLRRLLVEYSDELAQLISDCVGKTRLEALATEILPSAAGSRWYQKHARRALQPQRLHPGSLLFLNKHSTVYRVPWGVVGIIAPWNYPLGIPMHEIVPALLAGNSVLFKTAPETLPVAVRLAELIQQTGVPENIFTHINIDGPLCGDLFLEPGGVDKLFFTGSVRVGKLLMVKAAQTLTPLSLELGGKDAMIVCADADLERAANGAVWAGLSNAGQSCAGVERLYVHESVYTSFMALLKQRVETLRVGRDVDFNVDVGAICTDRQIETIRRHVSDALAQGATVFAQAAAPAGAEHFVAPLVLTDVTHEMAVMREETFGPVLGVMRFHNDEGAVQLANDSNYGLTASVWSNSRRHATHLARRIRAGAVTINDHLLSHGLTETPWGGFKDSGMGGRGHGGFAFEEMTAPQVIVSDRLAMLKRQLFWQPYSQRAYLLLKRVMSLLFG